MVRLQALNENNSTQLLQPGTAHGASLQVDLLSLSEHVASRAASIKRCTSAKHGLVALKVIFAPDVRLPHDIRKEARLLAQLQHPLICPLYNAYYIDSHYILALPFYPLSLRNLLDNPSFTPSASPAFEVVAKPFMRQMCEALAFLERQRIAHRDLAPSNWMIAADGSVALVDFGVAWSEEEPGAEGRNRLHFELGTGPYRAPELLFGSTSYDPFALDRWSLGTVLAEFFTAIEPIRSSSPLSDDSYSYRPAPSNKLSRNSLFDGGLSDFTLIGSIFKTLGTPTLDTWPEASSLPDFGKFAFKSFPPSDLVDLLPNLLPDQDREAADFIGGFLKYPYGERRSAGDALLHRYLKQGEEQAIPPSTGSAMLYQGKELHEWLAAFLQ